MAVIQSSQISRIATDFLYPFFLVYHWAEIEIDWGLLIIPLQAGGNRFMEISRMD